MSVRKLRKPLLISRPLLGAIDGFTIGLILGLWTDFLWLAKKIVIFDESMSYVVALQMPFLGKRITSIVDFILIRN